MVIASEENGNKLKSIMNQVFGFEVQILLIPHSHNLKKFDHHYYRQISHITLMYIVGFKTHIHGSLKIVIHYINIVDDM